MPAHKGKSMPAFLRSGLLPLFVLLFLALPAWAAPGAALRVALLLENPPGDHGWNDALTAGLDRARVQLGVEAHVLVAPEDTPAALRDFFRNAAKIHDLVLIASDRLHETLRNNAADFRKTMFGCLDAGIRAPNIMSFTFADEQAAFLAGAAAAMLTAHNTLPGINAEKTIGWISGRDTPAMLSLLHGFTEGARAVDPETRVIHAVTGSFTDAAAGRAAAQSLLEQGADVLALACGAGNGPALEEIARRKAYAVGLDTDQAARAPGHILTSILKYPDKALFDLVAAAAAGKFQGKEIRVRDLENGGVDIADITAFRAAVGKNVAPHMERRLRELRHEIVSGGIRLKSLRARTLCDCL